MEYDGHDIIEASLNASRGRGHDIIKACLTPTEYDGHDIIKACRNASRGQYGRPKLGEHRGGGPGVLRHHPGLIGDKANPRHGRDAHR